MTIKEFLIKFGLDVDQKQMADIEKGVDRIKYGLIGVAGVAVTATAALLGIVGVSAHAADVMYKQALAAGVSVETLQSLGYAAEQSGSSVEELAGSLRYLSRNIAEAAEKGSGPAYDTFKKLGISVKDANGRLKTSDAVFKELSARFQNMPDRAKKVQVAMDLMGRSGSNMIEILSKGPDAIQSLVQEAEEFGVMTEQDVENLKDYNDAIGGVLWIFRQLRNFMASALAPALTDMVKEFKEYLVTNKDIIKQNLTGFLKGMLAIFKVVYSFAKILVGAFTAVVKVFGGAETATKLFGMALLWMSGTYVVSGILTLIKYIRMLTWSVIAAEAAALAIPALIAAAVIAVVLIIEDFYRMLKGDDSVIAAFGQWLDSVFMPAFLRAEAFIVDWVKGLPDMIWNAIKSLGSAFLEIGSAIGADVWQGMKGAIGLGGSSATSAANPANAVSPTSILPSSASSSRTSNVQVSAPISVTVPPNTDPGMVGEKVETGIAGGLFDIFKVAERAQGAGVVY